MTGKRHTLLCLALLPVGFAMHALILLGEWAEDADRRLARWAREME